MTATPTTQRARVKTAGQGMTFDNVSMHFPDGTHAVDDVSFSIGPGEFVSVVGPSGCGKSTLLKMASGLLPATGGEVTVDRNGLGYVFQDATLLPWRTVQKNVEFLGELEGMSKVERAAAAKEAIELVGLKGFEDKYPISLSGGMKMRCSLARVLTLKPGTFLFDEPFGALDEITRERLKRRDAPAVRADQVRRAVHHPLDPEAVYMSTRVLVMSARPGRIIATSRSPSTTPTAELRFEPEVRRTLRTHLRLPPEAHA